MSTTTRNPGDSEAEFAGLYLAELYGSASSYAQGTGRLIDGRLVSTYAEGDRVRWWRDGWHTGLVVDVIDEQRNTYHVVERLPGGERRHHEIEGDAFAPF